ncbi:hypothetical protein DFJ73DRAFT_831720 [Zopfochytrium polystomum]|nr:hypothetical protein DFJ73DRAFT_831720 [Zopfochytrium polystomum]
MWSSWWTSPSSNPSSLPRSAAPNRRSMMARASPAPAETCSVCLAGMALRGGEPLINPGCGHQLHLACYNSCVSSGNLVCPTCRVPFVLGTTAPPAAAPFARPVSYHGYPLPGGLVTASPNAPTSSHVAASPYAPTSSHVAPPLIDDPVAERPAAEPANDRPAETENDFVVVLQPAVSVVAEYDSICPTPPGSAPASATALVSLRIPSAPRSETVHTNVDIVAVVDVSGSMSGSKLESVKLALKYIISTLTPTDRLSIVSFADSAMKQSAFLKCGEGSRLFAIAENLQIQGGTCMYKGVDMGLSILAARSGRNPASALLLLSDGADYPKVSIERYHPIINRSRNQAVPIFTFGFGEDADDTVLTKLAGTTGSYAFVEANDTIQDAFAGCLGAFKSTLFSQAKVCLETPAAVRIVKIETPFPKTITDGGKKGSVDFGSLFAEERRDFVVDLAIDEKKVNFGEFEALQVNCSYQSIDSERGRGGTADTIPVVLSLQWIRAENIPAGGRRRNPQVVVELLRLRTVDRVREAMNLAERSRISDGQRLLADHWTEIWRSASETYDADRSAILAAVGLAGDAGEAGTVPMPATFDVEALQTTPAWAALVPSVIPAADWTVLTSLAQETHTAHGSIKSRETRASVKSTVAGLAVQRQVYVADYSSPSGGVRKQSALMAMYQGSSSSSAQGISKQSRFS